MTWTVLFACMAALGVAQSAAAQSADREGRWETKLGVVFQNSTDADFNGGTSAEFESDTAFRLGFAYHYTDTIEFGVNLGLGTTDYKASIATDLNSDGNSDGFTDVRGDLEFTTFLANATWNMLPGPFSPFVTGGIGWSWVDTNIANEPPQVGCWWDPWWGYVCTSFQDTRTIDGLTYQLGAGARYDFSDTLAVHGSYRINWIDFDEADGTPDFDGFELSIGWKF
jgi:opacity protein-like surface antigen